MCPYPKDPSTRRQAPNQGMIESGKPFRFYLPSPHRLPYGRKVAISRHSTRKSKVQEQKRGDFNRWSGWGGGEECHVFMPQQGRYLL